MKVVIVDDILSNVVLLQQLVDQIEGCEQVSFTDPREALAWCEQHDPDLVLVDYMMPELDGIEFLQRFRSRPNRSSTPVVLITAYGERDILYRALGAGANDFLIKPVDKREFTFRIRNLLALRRRQNELAAQGGSLSKEIAGLATEIRGMRDDGKRCGPNFGIPRKWGPSPFWRAASPMTSTIS